MQETEKNLNDQQELVVEVDEEEEKESSCKEKMIFKH